MLYTWAGPEIAVATTKAYSTQMAVLNMLGLYFGDILGTIDRETYSEMVRDLQRVPEYIEKILESAESIHEIAKKICRSEDVFFIGRNL
ncbi:MAG TPA: glutamine--fructose-6-phosphate aminotransferase, partial [Oscillibacter sp.]|nr:glutamine--fructose-6-phosphate aminotransferase [Oscillibacter sp.]